MKKFLPYAPLALLMVGVFSVQLGNSHQIGIMSNTLSPVSGEVTVEICAKPEAFTEKGETSWCNIGQVNSVEKHRNSWNWSCNAEKETKKCYFTENTDYPTRGGVLFHK